LTLELFTKIGVAQMKKLAIILGGKMMKIGKLEGENE
jgi:hypothetical protein